VVALSYRISSGCAGKGKVLVGVFIAYGRAF
jgi:hypothetical protein